MATYNKMHGSALATPPYAKDCTIHEAPFTTQGGFLLQLCVSTLQASHGALEPNYFTLGYKHNTKVAIQLNLGCFSCWELQKREALSRSTILLWHN